MKVLKIVGFAVSLLLGLTVFGVLEYQSLTWPGGPGNYLINSYRATGGLEGLFQEIQTDNQTHFAFYFFISETVMNMLIGLLVILIILFILLITTGKDAFSHYKVRLHMKIKLFRCP